MAEYCIHCESWDVVAQLRRTGSYRYYCRYCKRLANAVLIRESYQEKMEAQGWMVLDCWCYHGVYDAGYLEVSPEECPDCAGNGVYWVTPSGRLMDYPSGHFIGRLTKEQLIQERKKYGTIHRS